MLNDNGSPNSPREERALLEACATVRLLVLDVDGVLSDGRSWQDAKGRFRRSFSIRDAIGLRRWRKSGGKFAVITDLSSADVREEVEKLGVDFFIDDCEDKAVALKWILKSEGLILREVAFFGAAEEDMNLVREAGISVACPNAPEQVRAQARFVTRLGAGDGAVAEACGVLLRSRIALGLDSRANHGRVNSLKA